MKTISPRWKPASLLSPWRETESKGGLFGACLWKKLEGGALSPWLAVVILDGPQAVVRVPRERGGLESQDLMSPKSATQIPGAARGSLQPDRTLMAEERPGHLKFMPGVSAVSGLGRSEERGVLENKSQNSALYGVLGP